MDCSPTQGQVTDLHGSCERCAATASRAKALMDELSPSNFPGGDDAMSRFREAALAWITPQHASVVTLLEEVRGESRPVGVTNSSDGKAPLSTAGGGSDPEADGVPLQVVRMRSESGELERAVDWVIALREDAQAILNYVDQHGIVDHRNFAGIAELANKSLGELFFKQVYGLLAGAIQQLSDGACSQPSDRGAIPEGEESALHLRTAWGASCCKRVQNLVEFFHPQAVSLRHAGATVAAVLARHPEAPGAQSPSKLQR